MLSTTFAADSFKKNARPNGAFSQLERSTMPPLPEMPDSEILAALRSGGAARERAWEFMYKKWKGLWLKMILDAGGRKTRQTKRSTTFFTLSRRRSRRKGSS